MNRFVQVYSTILFEAARLGQEIHFLEFKLFRQTVNAFISYGKINGIVARDIGNRCKAFSREK